ncbi:MAG TPA: DNA polymerase I [Myxococcota bacterium]|nr:DNA polymerase I [Myxococcota bacterium]
MSKRPTLHLIDGSGYIFRAYYAVRPLSTRTGVPTNAVVGFAKMLQKLLREEQPTELGIAFDPSAKNFRHELYGQYKANRESPPEDLGPQFPLIHKLVEAMDIPILQVPGYEADDVLATLARKAIARGFDVMLVSGDKDLMQLVGDHLTMFDPLKDKYYDRAAVIERFGVPPEHVADVLGLSGDTSDNIPGVPKVGPKSAAKLVESYGDVERVITALAALPKRKAFEENVVLHAEQARLSKRLAVLAEDAPIELDPEGLRYTRPQAQKLGPFLKSIEAFGMLRDFGLSEAEVTAPAAVALEDEGLLPAHEAPLDPIQRGAYQTVFTLEALDAIIAAARKRGELSIDLETTSIDPARADIVGVALAVPGTPPVYVPTRHHYLGVPKQLPTAAVLERLKPLLEDPAVVKLGQHLKYDWVVFHRAGVQLAGIRHDAMLAAYVLDPARASYGLDALAREFLAHQNISYNDVTGTGKSRIGFEEVPVEQATQYAAEDADVALHLCKRLWPQVDKAGLTPLYRDIEIPLVPVLAEMEATGVLVDTEHLKRLAKEFNARLVSIEDAAYAEIGAPVNLGSPKQLAHLFFEKLGYPVIKKTKTGYSTDQEVLETLAKTYELPRIILEHRLLAKLKSTYVDALPKMRNPETGRVHTSFNQTGTATGRLSSSDPNLQNIPIRSEDGRRIRAAFIAPEGCEIISADYSQVELRIMAHLSEDAHFVEAFRNNEDIHRRTAMEILTGGAEPDGEMRRRAKAINFGILYGLSEFGLSRQLGIPRAEAHAYIAAYFGRYPRIRQFLDASIEQGRREGYVSTMTGRRRYLPNLRSKNGTVRQGAERIAMNTPIQGSAADLIKLAMLRVRAALKQHRLRARLLLQVHDELVLEAPREERDAVTELLQREMSGVLPLRVPVLVEVGHGPNWAEAQ